MGVGFFVNFHKFVSNEKIKHLVLILGEKLTNNGQHSMTEMKKIWQKAARVYDLSYS